MGQFPITRLTGTQQRSGLELAVDNRIYQEYFSFALRLASPLSISERALNRKLECDDSAAQRFYTLAGTVLRQNDGVNERVHRRGLQFHAAPQPILQPIAKSE